MKHVKLFEDFYVPGQETPGQKFIWMGFSNATDGYCAGVVTKDEADELVSNFGGECVPLGRNIYAYIDIAEASMRPETANLDIDGLSFISSDCEDNYWDEPDYEKIVIELPEDGIIVTSPDQNGWNAVKVSVPEFIKSM